MSYDHRFVVNTHLHYKTDYDDIQMFFSKTAAYIEIIFAADHILYKITVQCFVHPESGNKMEENPA